MKIVVCAKVVPSGRDHPTIDGTTGRLVRDAGILSDLDACAVEAGVVLKEEGIGDEVVVVSVAPPASLGALTDALAMGADRVEQVADERIAGSDLLATSRILATVIQKETPDLVLFGPAGHDANGAMLWAAVAERLGLPSISQADQIEVSGDTVLVTRQTEAGFETLRVSTPAVVGVSATINSPRFVSFAGKAKARKKPHHLVDLDALGLTDDVVGDSGSGTTVVALRAPKERAAGRVIEAGVGAAAEILDVIRKGRAS